MGERDIFFSIVIPVYNVERYLKKCVDSVLRQSFGAFELILVDDGSTDDSPRICDGYASADSRVRVFHKENAGSNSARNMGILASVGDYVCLVDSDDAVSERWLETVYEALGRGPEDADIVLYGWKEVFADHVEEGNLALPAGFYDRERLTREVFPRILRKSPPRCFDPLITPAPWNKVYRRELLRAHICEDTDIKVANDCAFTYECVLYANSVTVCEDALYYYTADSEGSLQRSHHPQIIKNDAALFRYMWERLAKLHPTMPWQLNGFNAEHIRLGLENELAYEPRVSEAAKRLKEQFESTGILKYVRLRGLPLKHKLRIIMLKLGWYRLCLALQRWIGK